MWLRPASGDVTAVCQQLYKAVRAADRYALRLRFPTTPSQNNNLCDLIECLCFRMHMFVTVLEIM